MSATGTAAAPATTFAQLWDNLKAEAVTEIAKLKADAVAFEANIVPTIEADIVTVLDQFKSLAINTVLKFAQAEFANMSGEEKLGNVVTTVVQAAESAGKSIALGDAQTLAQQAFNAVSGALAPAAQ